MALAAIGWALHACPFDDEDGAGGGGGGGDWPLALRDARGTAHAAKEHALTRAAIAEMAIAWEFDAAQAGHAVGAMHATPVVADGRVYIGSMLGYFYAIGEDGQLAWEALARPPDPLMQQVLSGEPIDGASGSPVGYPIRPVTTPIISAAALPPNSSLVVFGDYNGTVYALDRETGEERWVFEDVDGHPLGGLIGSSLLAFDDTLVVGFASLENLGVPLARASGYECCTFRGLVVALDVASGEERWRLYTVPEPEPLPVERAPYSHGPAGGGVWGQPTYDATTRLVYVGTGQNYAPPAGEDPGMIDSILAIDAESGELRWHYAAEQRDVWHNGVANPDGEGGYTDKDFSDSPKLYDLPGIGRVVGAGQKSGDYHLLDAHSGELLSRTPHLRQAGSLGGFQYLGAVADGVVYQHGLDRLAEPGSGRFGGRGGFQGTVLALSGDGSEVKWRFDRPGSMLLGGLAVAGAGVFVQSPVEAELAGDPPQWALYALDAADGHVLARVTFEGVAVSNPAVSRSRVYIGGGNSAVGRFVGAEADGRVIALQIPERPRR